MTGNEFLLMGRNREVKQQEKGGGRREGGREGGREGLTLRDDVLNLTLRLALHGCDGRVGCPWA